MLNISIVINEILSNPRSEGSDFIEIYNQTDKFLTLENCVLSKYGNDGELEAFKIITSVNKQIAPKDYLVLTENAFNISKEYPGTIKNNVLEMAALPSMSDAGGNIIFINAADEIIDQVLKEFRALIIAYNNPEKGFTARDKIQLLKHASDYDQLSRKGEWQDSDEPDPKVVP